MSNGLSFLFVEKEESSPVTTSDLRSLVSSQANEAREEIKKLAEEYDNRLNEAGELSLAECLSEMGLVEETSTNGWPQVSLGDGEKATLCRNSFSGINAIVKMATGKYKVLDWRYHEAWFDPRRDAQGVISVFDGTKWRFFDWVNGAIKPAAKMGTARWKAQVRLHEEIDRIINTVEFGGKYAVVLNRSDEQEHYNEKVTKRLELSVPELWDALLQDAKEGAVKRSLSVGNGSGDAPVNEKRTAFAEMVGQLDTPHNIKAKTSMGEVTIYYNPEKKEAALRRILRAAPGVEFIGVEKVAE